VEDSDAGSDRGFVLEEGLIEVLLLLLLMLTTITAINGCDSQSDSCAAAHGVMRLHARRRGGRHQVRQLARRVRLHLTKVLAGSGCGTVRLRATG